MLIPSFLTIKARQIEDWAEKQIDARNHLPVLLRKLVHSTGNGLRHVDFPGYDNAQRKGSDGFIQATIATPWVPDGDSYWEFGTDQRPGSKAEGDYLARLTSIDPAIRAESTFIFVTPRNWRAKSKWEKGKNATGEWKSVRVFDASDLEQWLEQSVPAQIWLAEQIALTTSGYETLDQAWKRWINASTPALTQEIFAPSIAAYRDKFKSWLEEPSDRPFIVAADSRDEALAFLACLFDSLELRQFKDITAVFTLPEVLRFLISSSVLFIPIVHSELIERELIDVYRRLHCIVIRPRNTVDTEVDIKLDLLSHEAFKTALVSMGIQEGDIDKFSRESGRSPTILRRRLSHNAAIKKPEWAGDDDSAKTLVPIVLIGTWHSEKEADRKIVSNLAGRDYETIERDIARLLGFDDSPVWSAGHYRGVASKIDALFAVARLITSVDLNRFFLVAEYVLSEFDPVLDLPEKDRWAAALYEKTRNHSSALRTAICETLVILSVHGNNLFQSRAGIDVEGRVVHLIRKLLTPLTFEKLLSHDRDLPHYAEAAPDEFIRIIEEDLKSENPIVLGLLKSVDSSFFGVSPLRTGLLWGLECLAWKPQNLPRVAKIFSRLSLVKIDDNWANKPENSLQAIFRSWMPQTAASIDQRVKVLEMLIKRFPTVGWELCLEQIKLGSRLGHYSYKPKWRSDGTGVGQIVTRKEMYDFKRKALDLLIAWSSHDERTLGDMVESLQGIPKDDQSKIWDLIDTWSQSAGDLNKAELRERIRQFAFTRRSHNRKLGVLMRERAREAYNHLKPANAVICHRWLFAEQWVQESLEDIEEDNFDYYKWEEQIKKLRHEAITQIWSELGFQGIKELIASSGAAGVVGYYVSLIVTSPNARIDFILRSLSLDGSLRSKGEWCLQGFLSVIEVESCNEIIQKASEELTMEDIERLLVCAPFQSSTWSLLERYSESVRIGYWQKVTPSWRRHTSDELFELINCLLQVSRPRAAFHAAHMDFDEIATPVFKQLLHDIATVNAEAADEYKLNSYHISQALDSLDGRPDVTPEEMAQLEFLFITALEDSKHGIPNLEDQIAKLPILFVQAVALAYRRKDEGEDPPEWRLDNSEQQNAVALASYHLLNQITKIPGQDAIGKVDTQVLVKWLSEVRRLCKDYGRAAIGDQHLGRLLARAPAGENGIWPCEAICEVMEEISSTDIGKGFHMEVINSRGVYWSGDDGEQERELAIKYRTLADNVYFDYPFVGGILRDVAEFYEREAKQQESEADVTKRIHD